jgi:hypothetical protein
MIQSCFCAWWWFAPASASKQQATMKLPCLSEPIERLDRCHFRFWGERGYSCQMHLIKVLSQQVTKSSRNICQSFLSTQSEYRTILGMRGCKESSANTWPVLGQF